MKLASYRAERKPMFGAVVGDGVVNLNGRLKGDYRNLRQALEQGALDEMRQVAQSTKPDYKLTDIKFLPVIPNPKKILCIGINYNRDSEYKGQNLKETGYPSMFYRHPGSLVGQNHPIILPKESDQLDYEGEIALVIGREGKKIPKERAHEYIAGLTLCNEGCLRDWMRHGKFNVTQGKNFDASGSIGPWIVTADELDPATNLHLTTTVNGEVRQDTTTAMMMLSFADLIAYVTRFMTLKPGDIISTGTPLGSGMGFDPPRWLQAGDVVEVTVPQIGTLRNAVVAET